jgi:uncharacterized protein YqfB (UPF0267 family)
VLNGKTLKKNTDYEVKYQNASGKEVEGLTESGKYKIIINALGKGKIKYEGSKELDITVMEDNAVAMNSVKVAVNAVDWKEGGITTGIIKSVKYGNTDLVEGKDFEVDYSNTINSGKQTITLKAKEESGYVGTKTVTVNVIGIAMSKVKVEGITAVDYNGTGNLQQNLGSIKLKYKSKTETKELTLNKDYTVSYENNNKAGTAKIVFTGKGQYNGTLKKTFKINKAKLGITVKKQNVINSDYCEIESSFKVTTAKDNKKAVQLTDLKVYYNGVELKLGTDYTLSYKNNKVANVKKGKTPQVTITGKGNYQGKFPKNFVIEIKDN